MENRIKAFRSVMNWTQIDLSNKSGVALSQIGLLEQGVEKGVSDSTRMKIADAFHAEFWEVFPVEGKLNHVEFRIDRMDRSKSFLKINGHLIRFLNLEIVSKAADLPIVKISIFARILKGEIKGAMEGELQIIHIDESTKGLISPDEEIRRKGWAGPGAAPDGCPASSVKFKVKVNRD